MVLQKGRTTLRSGSKARNLYQHICAARAASGMPGGHGQPKHLLRNFLGRHNGANRRTIYEASGHESRCASEGIRRKNTSMLAPHPRYVEPTSRYRADRSESRRQYRKWIQDALEDGKFTLVHPRHPPERVTIALRKFREPMAERERQRQVHAPTSLNPMSYVQTSLFWTFPRALSPGARNATSYTS